MPPLPNAFHQLLLFQFAAARRLTVDELVARTLPGRTPPHARRAWAVEVELACELLALRRLLRPEPGAGGRAYVASARVLRLLPGPVRHLFLQRLAAPLAAAMLVQACATPFLGGGAAAPAGGLRSYWNDGEAHPTPVARRPAGAPGPAAAPAMPSRAAAPSYIEQYSRDSGGAVYRMCQDDCPQPTPKRPLRLAAAPPAAAAPSALSSPVALPPPGKDATPAGAEGFAMTQKGIAGYLAGVFGAKPPAPAGEATAAAAAPPDEAPAPRIRARAKKARQAAPRRAEEAPAAAPAAEKAEAPAAAPAPAANPEAFLDAPAPAAGPARAGAPLKHRYVDPRYDPNLTPEERARTEKLMNEAKAARSRPRAAPAPQPPGGTGAPQIEDMRMARASAGGPAATAFFADPARPAPASAGDRQARLALLRAPLDQAAPAAGIPGPLAPAPAAPRERPPPAAPDDASLAGGPDPRELLAAWAEAWSARDPARYFALYAGDFVACDGATARDFVSRRTAIMRGAASVEVAATPVAVVVRQRTATIRFWQDYRSPRFRSRVMKALELVRDGEGWKIRRERLVNYQPAAALRGTA